ncbi:hypothetical protein CC2G_015226 [Coprinopsis cinerea AmutBmut pab1-1]|nr:hypothetical protein CC2G_015148 [Coprinopsis cinerea AmutBmut pab1-1]KAG2007532.1 hypothetical protein CC2G_015226 [Coprinopsis cinerea AmutBmut pab1-1]
MDPADRALPLRRILLRRWNIRPVRDLPRSHVPAGEPQKLNEPSWNIQPVRDLPRSHVPAGEPQKLNKPSWNMRLVRDIPRSHVPAGEPQKLNKPSWNMRLLTKRHSIFFDPTISHRRHAQQITAGTQQIGRSHDDESSFDAGTFDLRVISQGRMFQLGSLKI